MDPISEMIVAKVANSVVGKAAEFFGKPRDENRTALEVHFAEVLSWSERIQFFGLSQAQVTDSVTIDLSLASMPRRFRGPADETVIQDEDSLLADSQHYLILGDPGSGKTTTLKRLARKLFLQPPRSIEDAYEFPVVLRFRDMREPESIFKLIADAIGLQYKTEEIIEQERVIVEYRLGGEHLDIAVPRFLDKAHALVIFDGLDELPAHQREEVEVELSRLAYRLRVAKVILTCRSGDHYSQLEGFDVLELCPLRPEQAEAIVRLWTQTPEPFLAAVVASPYRDLIDRPLFLTQLLFVFERYGYLPEQPSSVYRKITQLLLEDWDAQNKVRRTSRYAGFLPERKLEFLSALACHLTYAAGKASFDKAELAAAYSAVREPFDLPASQADEVASELETHTGLLVEGSMGRYEFSHLSLQEYLAAYYLVRDPFSSELGEYLSAYPGPVAVAIVLAADPGTWFAGLFLKDEIFSSFSAASLAALLSRLILEAPHFSPSSAFGASLLKVCFSYPAEQHPLLYHHMVRFLTLNGAKEAMARALECFVLAPEDAGTLPGTRLLRRRFKLLNPYGFELPEGGLVPNSLLNELIEVYGGAPGLFSY